MMRRIGVRLLLGLCLLALLGGGAPRPLAAEGATASYYLVTDLGAARPLDNYHKAAAINDAGQVVGVQGAHSFFYENGQMRDVNEAESLQAINGRGDAVGYHRLDGGLIAVSYQGGQVATIPGLSSTSVATGINDAGTIVGYVQGGGFIYEHGALRDIGVLPGMDNTSVFGINNRGQVVGSSSSVSNTAYPFIYDETGMHQLPPVPNGTFALAQAINDQGTVIVRTMGAGPERNYLYKQGRYRELLPDHPSTFFYAAAINEADQVVGGLDDTAFIHDGGQYHDLNDLIPADSGWRLQQANDINNRGQIVGYGQYHGDTRAFLLTPRFGDLPLASPYRDALLALNARGIVRGYGDGQIGPGDPVLRAQAAGLIARAAGWQDEDWADTRFSDQGAVDADLWRNVRTLAHRGVAQGYEDGTYNPTGPVTHQQFALFVARALIAQGAWQERADTDPYPNLPRGNPRAEADRRAIATYVAYAGALPDRPPGAAWADWDQPATRGWAAEILRRALGSTPTP